MYSEELFLKSADRLFPMRYSDNGLWSAEIDRLDPGLTVEYRYEVHSGGLCRRTEWEAHTVTMPDKAVRKPVEVTDRWNDVPEDLPLHSAPFRDGVFSRTPGKTWKAAGTAIPVFSLR